MTDDASARMDATRRQVLRAGMFGLGAAFAVPLLSSCGSSNSRGQAPAKAAAAGPPKRGGTLRIGATGGSPTDTVDADNAINYPDFLRVTNLYTPLSQYDADLSVVPVLAKAFESNSNATAWTIPLQQGVLFSNGKELTADDVVYTFQRVLNPKSPMQAAGSLAPVNLSSVRAADKYTVKLETTSPFASLPEALAGYHMFIVPAGYSPSKPIGSGAFVLDSFTPNSTTVMKRNPNYYQSGLPYLDEIVIQEFADYDAMTSALLSNQVDVLASIPPASVSSVSGHSGLTVFPYHTSDWAPFVMRTDIPPFDDNRVRQAFKLIVDRQNIVTSAFGGYAVIGNDHAGLYGPDYDASLPQREQNLDQAKSLLRQAGRAGMTVDLVVVPDTPGTLAMAEVFKQNAVGAGVNVNLVQPDYATFSSKYYGKSEFSQDLWNYFGYMSQCAYAYLPDAPYNTTHFDNAQFNHLYNVANATPDPTARREVLYEMQQIEYNEGGYIISEFSSVIDVYADTVHGLGAWKTGNPVNGNHLETVWMD